VGCGEDVEGSGEEGSERLRENEGSFASGFSGFVLI
jgi:hypothetical protein